MLDYLVIGLTKPTKNKVDKAKELGVKIIEEKDIDDLEIAISNTNDTYAKQIYTNLLNASYNHLNAFNRNLSRY